MIEIGPRFMVEYGVKTGNHSEAWSYDGYDRMINGRQYGFLRHYRPDGSVAALTATVVGGSYKDEMFVHDIKFD